MEKLFIRTDKDKKNQVIVASGRLAHYVEVDCTYASRMMTREKDETPEVLKVPNDAGPEDGGPDVDRQTSSAHVCSLTAYSRQRHTESPGIGPVYTRGRPIHFLSR
jgi:hypothetical protein